MTENLEKEIGEAIVDDIIDYSINGKAIFCMSNKEILWSNSSTFRIFKFDINKIT